MYPYHNRIKQRIRAGELVGYEYVEDYPRMGEALVLYFSTNPPVRPIPVSGVQAVIGSVGSQGRKLG